MSKKLRIAGLVSLVLGANAMIFKPLADNIYKPSTKTEAITREIIYDGISGLSFVGGILMYFANLERKRKDYREDWNKF